MDYRLALIGFGGVARALAELIRDQGPRLKASHGIGLSIVAVSDIKLGSVTDPDGLDLDQLTATGNKSGAFADLPNGQASANNEELIKTSNADILVEATFTNPKTGEPAVSHCRWALENGKHVITTNKGPVALAGSLLKSLADELGLAFEFEGAVMSGTPVLRFASNNLAGCQIKGFRGILNGTANFVLEKVEEGMSLPEAVKLAQELGYAEADPTADLEGSDVLLKVFILSNQLFGYGPDISEISRQGLSSLSEDMIRSALAENKRWKLIGQGIMGENGTPELSVQPIKLSANDPLAAISGATNAITIQTDLLGDVTVSGPGAGRMETAFALLSDIIAIHEKQKAPLVHKSPLISPRQNLGESK